MDEQLAKQRFGECLTQELLKQKISKSKLSERTGIDRSDISRYVQGTMLPGHDRFIRINDALGRSPGRTFMKVFCGE